MTADIDLGLIERLKLRRKALRSYSPELIQEGYNALCEWRERNAAMGIDERCEEAAWVKEWLETKEFEIRTNWKDEPDVFNCFSTASPTEWTVS